MILKLNGAKPEESKMRFVLTHTTRVLITLQSLEMFLDLKRLKIIFFRFCTFSLNKVGKLRETGWEI